MSNRDDVLLQYMSVAPAALAFERTLECSIYKKLKIKHPVLDIGCGDGLFAKLAFSGKIDTGVDSNPKELKCAKDLRIYKELIQCSGDKIPKPSKYYKTIFSNSVLEHIPDLKPVLKEAHRLLVPGGKFYFTVPSEKFDHYTVIFQLLTALKLPEVAEKYRRFYNKFWKHYHAYSVKKWCDFATKAGFKVVEAYTYDPKRVCMLNDFLVPFGLPAFILKKLTNRWVFFPSLRKVILFPVFLIAQRIINVGEKVNDGGLVFLALTKNNEKIS